MPFRWGVLAGLVLAFLAGCVGSDGDIIRVGRPPSLTEDPLPLDVVQIEVAVVRRELGDPAIDQSIWQQVDEQVTALERRPHLRANGLRYGISNSASSPLLRLLLDDRMHRPRVRRIGQQAGREHFLQVVRRQPTARILWTPPANDNRLRLERQAWRPTVDDRLERNVEQPDFGWAIRAEPDADGGWQVSVAPRVRHGQAVPFVEPAIDRGDWAIQTGRPEIAFPDLECSIHLASHEFAILGTYSEAKDTLGYHCLVDSSGNKPWQYLLVVRCWRRLLDTDPNGALRRHGRLESRSGSNRTSLDVDPLGPPPLAAQSLFRPRHIGRPVRRGQSAGD